MVISGNREIVFAILIWLTFVVAPAQPDSYKILMYHGIDGHGNINPVLHEQQIAALYFAGYNTVSLDEVYKWHTEPSYDLPAKPIVLTYDDNYITVHTTVYAILRKYGFCGVNYTHTNYVGVAIPGGNDHCDWDEIGEMESAGTLFTESHTKTHPHLTWLSAEDRWEEIAESKSVIEANIPGKVCNHIAYPYGDYNSAVITDCQNAGYQTATTVISGANIRGTPLFELRRIGINNADTLASFKSKIGFIAGDAPPPLHTDNTTEGHFTWVGDWKTTTSEPGYFGNNYRVATPGSGDAVSTWTISVPQTGYYSVYARWTSHPNRATDTPYTIIHALCSTTVLCNQQENGGRWMILGTYHFTAGEDATVSLNNNADGCVVADAVKVEAQTGVTGWKFY